MPLLPSLFLQVHVFTSFSVHFQLFHSSQGSIKTCPFQHIKVISLFTGPIIALCMGERGQPTRLLAAKYGGYLTFGAQGGGKESAPGQPTLHQITHMNRIPELTPHCQVSAGYGLLNVQMMQSCFICYCQIADLQNLPHAASQSSTHLMFGCKLRKSQFQCSTYSRLVLL